MKKYDPNNFVIDYVFAALDKKIKKEKDRLALNDAEMDEIITAQKENTEPVDDGLYHIVINV